MFRPSNTAAEAKPPENHLSAESKGSVYPEQSGVGKQLLQIPHFLLILCD